MEILEKIKEVKQKAKPRKFIQSWDLAINLKGLNLKKPENRINLEFALPEGRGKEIKVVVIADSLVGEAKKYADLVITQSEISALAKNKRKIKKIAKEYEWWFGEAPLMPLIGRELGVILGSRGKMPKPIPPKTNVEEIIQNAKRSVRVRVKDSPVIHVPVGTQNMEEEKIEKNIEAVYNFVKEHLPKGKENIRSVHLKLTMSPAIKIKI